MRGSSTIKRLFDVGDGLKPFVLDLDQVHRVERRVFVDRGDGRDGVADEAHFVYAERVLVLADGQNAVRNRQVPARDDGDYAGQRERF